MPTISDADLDPQALKRRLGGLVLQGNHAAAEEVRRQLRVARVAAAIKRELDQTPPLNEQQIERLRGLLPASAGEVASVA